LRLPRYVRSRVWKKRSRVSIMTLVYIEGTGRVSEAKRAG
jgi:hypothetical protein